MIFSNLIVNISEEKYNINHGRKWKNSVDEVAPVMEFGGG